MSTSAAPKYRHQLPQLNGCLFLTDGGLETTLIFHEGWDLPVFQAFVLLETERGRAALRAYFDRYVEMAVKHRMGFILESPTWRANPDWAAKIGYGRNTLADINCAHPTHFDHVLESNARWMKRLRGLRANSSRRSHAELDNSPELDIGNPVELGAQYSDLRRRFPHINVLGGCCGTDHRHVECIGLSCMAEPRRGGA